MPKKKKSKVSVSSQSDFTSSIADSEVSSISTVSVKQEKAPKGRFKALVQKIKQDKKKNEKTGEDIKKKKTDKQTEKGKKTEEKKETKGNEKIKETKSTTKKESKTGKKKTEDKKSKTKEEDDKKKKNQSNIKNPKKDKRTLPSTIDTDLSESFDDTKDMSPNIVADAGNIDRKASSTDGITISIRKKYFLTPEDSDEEEEEDEKGRRRSSWIGSFFIQLFLGLRSVQNTVMKMFRSKSIDSGHGVDAVSQSVVDASAKEVTRETDDASVSTASTRRKKKKSKFRWFWKRKNKGKLRPRKIKKSRGIWRRLTWFMRKKSSVQEPGNVLSAAMT